MWHHLGECLIICHLGNYLNKVIKKVIICAILLCAKTEQKVKLGIKVAKQHVWSRHICIFGINDASERENLHLLVLYDKQENCIICCQSCHSQHGKVEKGDNDNDVSTIHHVALIIFQLGSDPRLFGDHWGWPSVLAIISNNHGVPARLETVLLPRVWVLFLWDLPPLHWMMVLRSSQWVCLPSAFEAKPWEKAKICGVKEFPVLFIIFSQ